MDDPFFGPAVVDVDEWRDAPVRHRYIHGGFEGTDTRFSFYFPPAAQWKGRLLQTLEGGNGGHENTAQSGIGTMGGIAFALASGCYLVESKQGHFGDDMRILHGPRRPVPNCGGTQRAPSASWNSTSPLAPMPPPRTP